MTFFVRLPFAAKRKNLRAALPRDSAEDFIWKPRVSMFVFASHGPFDRPGLHIAEGASVNPIQVGFHLLKRKCLPDPFAAKEKLLAG